MLDLASCCRTLAGILAFIFALALLYSEPNTPPRHLATTASRTVITTSVQSDQPAVMLDRGR